MRRAGAQRRPFARKRLPAAQPKKQIAPPAMGR